MAQLTEIASLTFGEAGLSSTHSSVDVTAVLRNLKLRRGSCSTVAVPSLASPDSLNYDIIPLGSHPSLSRDNGNSNAFLSPVSTLPGVKNSMGKNASHLSMPGDDAVGITSSTASRLQLWGMETTPGPSLTQFPSSQFVVSAGNGTPAFVKLNTAAVSHGQAPGSGAAPCQTRASPPSARYSSIPTASPIQAAPKSAVAATSTRPAGAAPPLTTYASAPVSSSLAAALAAALAQHSASKLPPTAAPAPAAPAAAAALPLPLKAASSTSLLGSRAAASAAFGSGGGAVTTAAAAARPPLSVDPSQSLSASTAPGSPAGNGSNTVAALFKGGAAVLPQSCTTDGSRSHGSRRSGPDDVSCGSGGCLVPVAAGLGAGSGSGIASPSIRHSGVAATAFAAASVIVAATSAAAAAGNGGNTANVAAAAAEVASYIADSVVRPPSAQPLSPNSSRTMVAAAVGPARAAAATSPSWARLEQGADSSSGGGGGSGGGGSSPFGARAATGSAAAAAAGGGGGGASGGSLHGSVSSQRRYSLEVQVAKLRAGAAADQPQPNGYPVEGDANSGAGAAVAAALIPAAAASSPSRPSFSSSALVAQRAQLLDELQAAHKRELHMAEQLGRCRAEVLELAAQLVRQSEATATAAAAAEAEAGALAALREQLRRERAEAGEEVRRWRSRATAAEEQLQTALTQIASLRSAAALERNSSGGSANHSGGGGGTGWAPQPRGSAAAGGSSADLGFGPVGLSACVRPGSPLRSSQAWLPLPEAAAAAATVTSEPPSPQRGRSQSRDSGAGGGGSRTNLDLDLNLEMSLDLESTPPLRRSLSHQTLGGELAAPPPPPRAVSTSGGAGEAGEKGFGFRTQLETAIDSADSAAGSGSAPSAAAPQSPAASAASTAAATAAADGGGGSAAGISTPASATASSGSSYGSPASHGTAKCCFGRGGSGTGSGGEGSGGGWTWAEAAAAAAAAAAGSGSSGAATVATSRSAPTSDMVAVVMTTAMAVTVPSLPPDSPGGKGAVKGTGADAATTVARLPGKSASTTATGLAGNAAADTSATETVAAAGLGLPPDIMAPAEGTDGTAVRRRASAGPTVSAAAGGEDDAALAAEVERLKLAGNRAYRSEQFPLARHCYSCCLELLLSPDGGGVAAAAVGDGAVNSDGGGAERAAAAAAKASRDHATAATAAGGSGGGFAAAAETYAAAAARLPEERRRLLSALYCSRAAAHVAMRLYADAVADCCAASAHDATYAKPWKCRAEALASINAFGAAAGALERCIQLTTAAAAATAGKPAAAAASSRASGGGGSSGGAAANDVAEHADVDPRELPLLRHILQRLQELARAAAAPGLPVAAALLAAMTGAPSAAAAAPPVDHYAVLGVPHHASAMDVRAAYRRLALRYHPDKAAAAAAAATAAALPAAAAVAAAAGTLFPMVAEAYAVLSDGASRRAYDLRRARVTLSSKRSGAS